MFPEQSMKSEDIKNSLCGREEHFIIAENRWKPRGSFPGDDDRGDPEAEYTDQGKEDKV